MKPDWGPPIDWDAPNDGDTTAQMLAEASRREIEEEIEARRNALLWEKYAGHFGRDGSVVIPILKREE